MTTTKIPSLGISCASIALLPKSRRRPVAVGVMVGVVFVGGVVVVVGDELLLLFSPILSYVLLDLEEEDSSVAAEVILEVESLL